MQRIGSITWRIIKVLPIIGWLFVLASAAAVIRRKGYALGALAVTLDLLPIICLIKAGVEVFTGDLIPDKFGDSPAPHLEATA